MVSEGDILKLLKNKDKIAFDSLYEQYAPMLYGQILTLTDDISIACNLLKKSFTDIWRDIDLYHPIKTTLFTWMLKITIKNCQEVLQLSSRTISEKLCYSLGLHVPTDRVVTGCVKRRCKKVFHKGNRHRAINSYNQRYFEMLQLIK